MATNHGTCERCGLTIGQSFSCTKAFWTGDNGRRFPPIVWGSETGQWEGYADEGEDCPECGVAPGNFHHAACTIEQIPEGVNGPDPQQTPEPQPGLMPMQPAGCLMGGLYALGYGYAWLTASRRRVVLLMLVLFVIASRTCALG